MSIFLLKRIAKKHNITEYPTDALYDSICIKNYGSPAYPAYPEFYNRRFYAVDSPFKLDLRS